MASSKQLIVMFASLMLAGLVAFHTRQRFFSKGEQIVSESSQVEYSFYVFATEWAGAVCEIENCYLPSAPNFFNLHGLWPSTQDKNTSP